MKDFKRLEDVWSLALMNIMKIDAEKSIPK